MKPISIIVVTHYFSTHRGGIEQAAGHLASRLAQTGRFTVEWFASDSDAAPEPLPHLTPRPMRTWNGLEQWGMPWPLWSWGSLRRLAQAIRAADIVHLHDFIYFGNIAAFFIARHYQKPIIITQHTGDATYPNRLHALILKLINRTAGRFMLSRADHVVCISDEVRRQFTHHTRFRNAPHFWPNAVDTGVFFPVEDIARQALRTQFGVTSSRPVLLFVGRFVEMKGLALLRRLAEVMPEAHWWFAGWGRKDTAPHPANWNLPQVRVFENRSGAALAELYRAADLLVLPSFSEGFPLVVQEAMACGTSALLSLEAAIGSPVARPWLYPCSLTPMHSACVRWKDDLLEIVSDNGLAGRRASAADFARREWSWENNVARYSELLLNLSRPTTLIETT